MTNHLEHSESAKQFTKTDSSSALHDHVHQLRSEHSTNLSDTNSAGKHHEPDHLDLTNIWLDNVAKVSQVVAQESSKVINVAEHAGTALVSGAENATKAAWNGMDKDSNMHFLKHEILGDNPDDAKAAVVLAAGAGLIFTPTGWIVGTGLAAIGASKIAVDYYNRHNH